ncbi:MAG: amidohydrolase, partial [Bacteroidia bacterium]|nr:amidohydrolase [Bacteroidia bacterium]
HAHPELSFNEHQTVAYVSDRLTEFGISEQKKAAGTGLVALLRGKKPDKKTVALRADMDALPITEGNDVDYRSLNEGVMHACGHDVHTSSLLGVAKILSRLKNDFEGTVKFIFQPGEEKLPGGASLMIKEGALKNPDAQSIIGQHVMPFIETGKVGFRSGLYMASTDELYVTVKGKGGHGAMPHLTIDPVLIASNIIVSLQQIVSRAAQPIVPSVLSFGKVIADGATNIIPDEVYMEGTFRTFDEPWRVTAHSKMKLLAEKIAEGMGGKCDFRIERGYPVLKNDASLTSKLRVSAEDYLGKENVTDLEMWLAAEDFAYYSHEVPACFYRLGVRNEKKGIISPVHTPTFNIDEDALLTGMGLMAWLALEELNS